MRRHMNKKLFTIMTVLLITVLTTSPVAAGAVGLRRIEIKLGSLIATGLATGLGTTDVTLVLEGSGPADILCINHGKNTVPGQSYPKVTATGDQTLAGNDPTRKNGSARFNTVASTDEPLAWDVAGCPNANWVGQIDFVYWENVTISVYEGADPNNLGPRLAQLKYTCVTTRDPDTITCDPA